MGNPLKIIKNGIIDENPIFVQVIGMCPTLAVTTCAVNGVGMGLSTSAVLICSNFFIALIKRFIPSKVRIPAFIVVIAGFVTIVQFLMQAYFSELNESLGLYIPLIVVNCIILGRAEAFASKNSPGAALLDGIGMGIGFTIALTILGLVRELIGSGTVFNLRILPETFPSTLLFIMPPGAFISLGFIMAFINYFRNKNKKKKENKEG